MQAVIVGIEFFSKGIEVFLVYTNTGSASMATTTDDGVMDVGEGVSEIKIAKTAAGPLIDSFCSLGKNKGGLVVVFDQVTSDDAENTFVPMTGFDDDWSWL